MVKAIKLVFVCTVVLLLSARVAASDTDHPQIEREVTAFMNEYLAVYNRRFGHPERSAQFRRELGDIVLMPLLQSPPMSKPRVHESLDDFTRNFESFVTMLEGKNVARLEWEQVELHVLTENKVLVNNTGRGLTKQGEVAYETISLYLVYRDDDRWRIAMFSPYSKENVLHLAAVGAN